MVGRWCDLKREALRAVKHTGVDAAKAVVSVGLEVSAQVPEASWSDEAPVIGVEQKEARKVDA